MFTEKVVLSDNKSDAVYYQHYFKSHDADTFIEHEVYYMPLN